MSRTSRGAHDAWVHTGGPPAATDGPVYDLRAFARNFVLLGVEGQRVVVRRKGEDATGTLRFQPRPLVFFQFRPLPDGNARSPR